MSESLKPLTHEQVRAWVKAGFAEGREAEALTDLAVAASSAEDEEAKDQARASTLVWGAVLHAAKELCPEVEGSSRWLSATWHKRQQTREPLVERHWTAQGGKHAEAEVLVDFLVSRHDATSIPGAASRLVLTVESEMGASHGVSASFVDGYARDFFKLLVVQADFRLFFARVGGPDGKSLAARLPSLSASLSTLCDRYRNQIANARLACILMGAGRREDEVVSVGIWNGEKLDWQPAFPASEPT
jgi:hypothetical protein